jgi:RNA polymerase sigma factor (sigma-70 family)
VENDARRVKYAKLNDEALIAALRAEEGGAFVELVQRYQGLVFKYARYFGVSEDDQQDWVSDLLHDVVLSLIRPGSIIPESLGSYFARACRNKVYMAHRSLVRRQVREARAFDYEGGSDAVVESACSETMLRDSRGPDWEDGELAPPLLKLVIAIEKLLSPEERQLLDWSVESVPLRLIAEWCGITRTGVSHRLSRLRQRLQRLTPGIVEGFSAAERVEIGRFLLRAKSGASNVR